VIPASYWKQVREAEAKATPGPWEADSETYPDWRTMWHQFDTPLSKGGLTLHWTACRCCDESLFTAVVGNGPNSAANAAFIAISRTALPLALARIEELEAALEQISDSSVASLEATELTAIARAALGKP
jgi:hypothetical protein